MQIFKIKPLAVLAIAAALLLQGCGWHLRGAQPLPQELQSLHLQTVSENSAFTRSLKRSLKAMDVSLIESATDAPYSLKVSNITNTSRTLSVTSSARVAEYEITSSLTYSVSNIEGEQVVVPTLLSTEKTYLYNRNNATSAFEEKALLHKEMERDLIQQLIRRYRAIKPSIEVTEAE